MRNEILLREERNRLTGLLKMQMHCGLSGFLFTTIWIAADAKISKAAAGAALDSFTKNVTKALKSKDGKVSLVGFGTFSKAKRAARKGRNPQTGAAIKIKARTVVKFKAGKKLKKAV